MGLVNVDDLNSRIQENALNARFGCVPELPGQGMCYRSGVGKLVAQLYEEEQPNKSKPHYNGGHE